MKMLTVLCALALGFSGSTLAAGDAVSPVTVHDAYAYATAEGQANGAAFLTIGNAGAEADRLTAVSAGISETAEMHTLVMDGDVMKMRKVESFDVPAGGTATLKPGGDHIMLMGLKTRLAEGSDFPLTLTFEKAGPVDVTVHVMKPGMAHEGMAHEGMGHGH